MSLAFQTISELDLLPRAVSELQFLHSCKILILHEHSSMTF